MERQSLSNQSSLQLIFRRADFWLIAGGLILLGLLFWQYSAHILEALERVPETRAWIESYGPLAPLAYISLYVMQIVAAPLPGNFMGILAGYLFGILWGAVYSVMALTIGVSIAVGLSRYFGRPLLERFVSDASLEKWESKLRIRSPLLWAILFMFPVPDALIYVAGLSSLPLRTLIPAIVIGRSAGIIFANVVGGWSAQLASHWQLVNWSVFLALGVLVYAHQRRVKLYTLLGYRRGQRFVRQWRARRQWKTGAQATRSGQRVTALASVQSSSPRRVSPSDDDERT